LHGKQFTTEKTEKMLFLKVELENATINGNISMANVDFAVMSRHPDLFSRTHGSDGPSSNGIFYTPSSDGCAEV